MTRCSAGRSVSGARPDAVPIASSAVTSSEARAEGKRTAETMMSGIRAAAPCKARRAGMDARWESLKTIQPAKRQRQERRLETLRRVERAAMSHWLTTDGGRHQRQLAGLFDSMRRVQRASTDRPEVVHRSRVGSVETGGPERRRRRRGERPLQAVEADGVVLHAYGPAATTASRQLVPKRSDEAGANPACARASQCAGNGSETEPPVGGVSNSAAVRNELGGQITEVTAGGKRSTARSAHPGSRWRPLQANSAPGRGRARVGCDHGSAFGRFRHLGYRPVASWLTVPNSSA